MQFDNRVFHNFTFVEGKNSRASREHAIFYEGITIIHIVITNALLSL